MKKTVVVSIYYGKRLSHQSVKVLKQSHPDKKNPTGSIMKQNTTNYINMYIKNMTTYYWNFFGNFQKKNTKNKINV